MRKLDKKFFEILEVDLRIEDYLEKWSKYNGKTGENRLKVCTCLKLMDLETKDIEELYTIPTIIELLLEITESDSLSQVSGRKISAFVYEDKIQAIGAMVSDRYINLDGDSIRNEGILKDEEALVESIRKRI